MMTEAEKESLRHCPADNLQEGFNKACSSNQVEVVKFLLEDDKLPAKIDLHWYSNSAFMWACKNNNPELIEYYLSFPSMSEQNILETALVCFLTLGQLVPVTLLLTHYEIEITEYIQKVISSSKLNEDLTFIQLLKLKELNKELTAELENNPSVNLRKVRNKV